MSGLLDDTSVQDLCIPGSHASCAVGNVVKLGYLDVTPKLDQKNVNTMIEMETYQYDDVSKQLYSGIRMLDVRVGPGLKINQGPFQMPQTLATVLDQAEGFLKTSNREFILVCISWCSESGVSTRSKDRKFPTLSSTSHDHAGNFANEVKNTLQNKGAVIYAQNSWPTVANARGKIIVLRNFKCSLDDCGIDVTDSFPPPSKLGFETSMAEQVDPLKDTPKPSTEQKTAQILQPQWDKIKVDLDKQHDKPFVASLSGRIRNDALGDDENWASPFVVSNWTKSPFTQWASAKTPGTYRLWVFADFAGAEFARTIARLNFGLVIKQGPKHFNVPGDSGPSQ
jgi:hypothetical protein